MLHDENSVPMVHHGSFEGSAGRMSALDLTCTPKESRGLVLFAHGYKGFKDWGPWPMAAHYFAERGLDFLKFNFSHNGGTFEQPIDFPDLEAFAKNTYSKELRDLNGLIDKAYHGIEIGGRAHSWTKIYIIGHSRGGAVATLAAASRPVIQGLAAWAAVADFGERFSFDLGKWQNEGVDYVENARTGQRMPHYFSFYTDYVSNAQQLDVLAAAATCTCKALVAHGTADEAVDISNAHRLHSAFPQSELLLIEQAGHTFGGSHPWKANSLPESLRVLLQATVDFFLSER